MPEAVEMPAPVRTTMRCALRTSSAIVATSDTFATLAKSERRVPGEDAPLVDGRWGGVPAGSARGHLQRGRVVERIAMTVVRPAGAVVTDRGMEPHRVQDAFDVVG